MAKVQKSDTKPLICEISWEVCNPMGGIYTVLRTKLPSMMARYGENYCLVGPAVNPQLSAVFDPMASESDEFGQAVERMRAMGYDVQYGRWLVTGRPRVVLFNPTNVYNRIANIKRHLWEDHKITEDSSEDMLNQCLMFGDIVRTYLKVLDKEVVKDKRPVIAHAHEWMGVTGLLDNQTDKLDVKTVFTTHATIVGRYLAGSDPDFYEKLPTYKWSKEAKRFGIESLAQIEHRASEVCDVFTTVSEVTAMECKHLYGRKPDVITPNGLNIERFAAYHEVQNRHMEFKDRINRFVMGHFFHNYSFDLDKTLYLVTSGRFEFHNKGYDLTLEALVRLNKLMKDANSDMNVVAFIITKRPTWSINPDVLESRGVMEEIWRNCKAIVAQVGQRLFVEAASSKDAFQLPNLNNLVDEYWKLRFRRTIQSWKTNRWPIIVTHNLKDDVEDPVLNVLRDNKLVNSPLDKVKIVYHPDFIDSTNPLFGIDYSEFIRGCHMGLFPSYYEPWGYTPLECVASGTPTVTTDLSGFGNYVLQMDREHEEAGIHVLRYADRTMEETADDLAQYLFHFVKTTRRYRMIQRNKLEDYSENFDWKNLVRFYDEAYLLALQNRKEKKSNPKSH